jgi:DNA-directed RNA polymerase specialized sigma subunit
VVNEFPLIEKCQQVLRRFAWRMQYRARKQMNHEFLSIDLDYAQETEGGLNIYIVELIESIQSKKGRYIIKRIYIDGLNEREVANELRISQQAVSKWKKKGLETMRRQGF